MITAIYYSDENGEQKKITTWTDTPESLVKAAREKIFSRRGDELIAVVGESGEIRNIRGDWFTKNEAVKDAAFELGYWIQRDDDYGFEILLTWTTDENRPPNRQAIHIAARALRAIPSETRSEQSRINGRKGGRKPKAK